MTLKSSGITGTIVALLISSVLFMNANVNATEIRYDKEADLPICVYKVIQDCKVRSGLICEADTTIDPCKDIFYGFTGTDENYKPETDQFIVPDNTSGFDGEDFKAGQHVRPPINPDFDPDYSCLFDVYQVQCIPGSEQECPEGFGNNEKSTYSKRTK
jgi:hypothetical protein